MIFTNKLSHYLHDKLRLTYGAIWLMSLTHPQTPPKEKTMADDSGNEVQSITVDCSIEQYSKEVLIDLVKLYSRLYLTMDGFWYLAMKNEVDNETALKNDLWVWEKMHKREFNGVLEALNIAERTLPNFFKAFMATPWMPQMGYEISFADERHAILTFKHCPTLIALENEGEGREVQICSIVEAEYLKNITRHFNPKIEVFPIQIPPRENRDGFCCKWGFTLND